MTRKVCSVLSMLIGIVILVQMCSISCDVSFAKSGDKFSSDSVIKDELSSLVSEDDFALYQKIKVVSIESKILDIDNIKKEIHEKAKNPVTVITTNLEKDNSVSNLKTSSTSAGTSDTISGKYESVSWSLNKSTGALVISGSGAVKYGWFDQNKNKLASYVKTVTIKSGLTEIYDNAFQEFTKLTSVSIPSSVKKIKQLAFYKCTSLPKIEIPTSVVEIGYAAFAECSNLGSAVVSGNIGESAFNYCTKLASVSIQSNCKSIGTNAFIYCKMGSITIPSTVTSIGDNAFGACHSLKSVSLPSSLTKIGNSVFYACKSLSSVIIPEGVTSIGNMCFAGDEGNGYCESLVSVTLPSSLKSVGTFLFEDCDALQNVSMPGNFTGGMNTFPESMFLRCTSLKTINIPRSITNIEKDAFAICTSLESVFLPANLAKIGAHAFYHCEKLKNISIPSTCSEIAELAFYQCYSIESISVPNSLTELKYAVFAECTALSHVDLGGQVRSVEDYAFNTCSSLSSITLPNSVQNVGEFVFANCEKLSEITLSNSMTELSQGLFYQCHNLRTVSLSSNIIKIKNHVFYDCVSLSEIHLPDSLTELGEVTFGHCVSLKEIFIPAGITEISMALFVSCENVEKVKFLGSVTKIDAHAFSGCYKLKEANIPSTVKEIGERAFIGCDALLEVNFPEGLETIGEAAFTYCYSIKNVNIPSTVTSIGDNAFTGLYNAENFAVSKNNQSFCSSDNIIYNYDKTKIICVLINKDLQGFKILDSITGFSAGAFYGNKTLDIAVIPSGVSEIPDRVFYGCSNLKRVIFNGNVTSIGDYAFAMCETLDIISLPDSLSKLGEGVFCECEKLEEITIPDKITEIPGLSFYGCRELSFVYIPQGITKIGDYAFALAQKMQEIEIPSSLNELGEGSFMECKSLQSVYLPEKIEYIEAFTFADCSELTDVICDGAIFAIGNYAFENDTNLKEVLFSGEAPQTVGEGAFDNVSPEMVIYYIKGSGGWTSPTWKAANNVTYNTATAVSGMCGSDISWTLSKKTGRLRINGTGKMHSWSKSEDVPWHSLVDSIQSVIIGEGITEIGARAFMGCMNMRSAEIANSVTRSGYAAFAECYSLEKVTSPKGLHFISEAMFYKCYSLSNVDFSDDLNTIDKYAFYSCSKMESVVIPQKVVQINEGVFAECVSLNTVRIFGSITKIDTGAFSNCVKLSILCFFGNEPTGIHAKAFYGQSDDLTVYSKKFSDSWTDGSGRKYKNININSNGIINGSCGWQATWSLDLNSGILSIGGSGEMHDYTENQLPQWKNLIPLIDSVQINSGITKIGDYNFYGMKWTEKISIPDTVTKIGKYAFTDCLNLWDIKLPESIETIGECAFADCRSITEISIPSKVKMIADNTFCQCSQLRTVILSDEVTNIGYAAFARCVNMDNFDISAKLGTIGNWAFAYCTSIGYIDLSGNISSIGEYAFLCCGKLDNIDLSQKVNYIGAFAFASSGLSKIEIPLSMTVLNNGIFANCNELSQVSLKNVKNIKENVFLYCTKLKNINIAKIENIGNNAFANSGLQIIEIPQNIVSVGEYAFASCHSLEAIFSKSYTYPSYSGILYNGKKLLQYPAGKADENVTVKDTTVSIAEGAFYGAEKIKTIVVPDNVSSIGQAAFAFASSLERADIGKNISVLPTAVFGSCKSLKDVYFNGNAPQLGTDVFYDTSSSLVLHAYDNTYGWTRQTWTGSDGMNYHTDIMQNISVISMDITEDIDNGYVNVRIKTTNGFSACDAEIILASYNSDSVLSEVRKSNLYIEPNDNISFSFSNITGSYVKAFIFDAQTHIPVADCVYKELSGRKIKTVSTSAGNSWINHDRSISIDCKTKKVTTSDENVERIEHSATIKLIENEHEYLPYRTIELIDNEGNEVGQTNFSYLKVSSILESPIDSEGKFSPTLAFNKSVEYKLVDHEKKLKEWNVCELVKFEVSEYADLGTVEAEVGAEWSKEGVKAEAGVGVDLAGGGIKIELKDMDGNELVTFKIGGKVGYSAHARLEAKGRKATAGVKLASGVGGEIEVEIDIKNILVASINGVYNFVTDKINDVEIKTFEISQMVKIGTELTKRKVNSFVKSSKQLVQDYISTLPSIYPNGSTTEKMPADIYAAAGTTVPTGGGTTTGGKTTPTKTPTETKQKVSNQVVLTQQQKIEILRTFIAAQMLGFSQSRINDMMLKTFGQSALNVIGFLTLKFDNKTYFDYKIDL